VKKKNKFQLVWKKEKQLHNELKEMIDD